MTETLPKISSFVLIDSAMLGGTEKILSMDEDTRPGWLIPVYKEDAASVSPLVIDIEAAHHAGQIDLMAALINAVRPQLHVSFIDTTLSHEALAQHLRHFILVRTEAGKELTLRFADCCILPALATFFSAAQWATLAGPIVRWRVHQRDGMLTTLPQADAENTPVPTPFVLTDLQIDHLREAAAVDQLIANVQNMRYGHPLSGNPAQQHQWAGEARRMWWDAEHTDNAVLFSLVEAVFDTNGELLKHPGLPDILAQRNIAAICQDLRQAVTRH
jgi:hypothetical protein